MFLVETDQLLTLSFVRDLQSPFYLDSVLFMVLFGVTLIIIVSSSEVYSKGYFSYSGKDSAQLHTKMNDRYSHLWEHLCFLTSGISWKPEEGLDISQRD